MVGILLGNVLMSVVFSVFWPVTGVTQARAGLAATCQALAELVQAPRPGFGKRLAVARAIAKWRQLLALAVFETPILSESPMRRVIGPELPGDLEKIAGAVFVLAEQDGTETASNILRDQDTAITTWLANYAATLREARPMPPPPHSQAVSAALNTLPADAPIAVRSAIEARLLLLSRIESVSYHAIS